MGEGLEQLVLTALVSIEQRQQMNALMAVMHQRLTQFGADIKVAQPVQPVHECLMRNLGQKKMLYNVLMRNLMQT